MPFLSFLQRFYNLLYIISDNHFFTPLHSYGTPALYGRPYNPYRMELHSICFNLQNANHIIQKIRFFVNLCPLKLTFCPIIIYNDFCGWCNMKKKDVLNLIKCYSENNDAGFRAQAYQIAKEFDSEGDVQLSEYILSLLSGLNTFVPQMLEGKSDFFKKIIPTQEPLPLPEVIKDDLIGLVNAVGHNIGINKFLFHGAPGTGKTESAKQVARLLERELYSVDFDSIIDSKLGQTSKNIATVFDELNNLSHPEKVVILFDEIDAIALDRTNTNDLREMGRATSSILKGFDTLNEKIVLIATTNLFSNFDKALSRRFDTIIDFNRYTNEDLLEIADIILDYYLPKIKGAGKNKKLFRKIMALMPKLPYPGELKNLIKTSLAFSTIGEEFDYLVKLYKNITGKEPNNLKDLQEHNFTVREIEILTGISKSHVSRQLQEM